MIAVICFAGLCMAGCQSQADRKAAVPATRSAQAADRSTVATRPSAGSWENATKGIGISYPANWQPKKNPDYELMLIPVGATSEDPQITLDIPDLPPHMPWMIQMNRIEHDYLADLKKSHPDLKLEDAVDTKVPNSTARLVRSNWHQDKIVHEDVVLFMIHASAVYILDARADTQHLPPTRAAFDAIEASIHWTK
jgi:hypothetical protein